MAMRSAWWYLVAVEVLVEEFKLSHVKL